MKVTEVRATIVSVPYKAPDVWSHGRNQGITSVLIEVETDEGLIGLGEANGDRSAVAVVRIIEAARPLIVGQEAFNIERIVRDFYVRGKWHNVRPFAHQALAGVEMALWDIVGKACGQPVHRLMGGLVHTRINFFYYLQRTAPAAMAEEASAAVEQGYPVIYFKVGLDEDEDVAALQAVRASVGTRARIRVDANEAWTPGQAVRMITKLEPFDPEFVEQPVLSRDFDGLQRVRAASRVPIAANQSCFTDFDTLEVIKRGAADIIVTGPHQAGGLLALKKIASMADTAGLPFCRHSVGELGVAATAGLHVLATLGNVMDGNQTHHQVLSDDVITEPLRLEGGWIDVPTQPGIGVTLDRAKVAQYAELYQREGQYLNY